MKPRRQRVTHLPDGNRYGGAMSSTRTERIGDSKVAVLESAGGRPTIVGNPSRTQDLLAKAVLGTLRVAPRKRPRRHGRYVVRFRSH